MNAYIYPNSKWKGIKNPYLDNFVESLESKFSFVNYKSRATTGIFDILKYINQLDYIFFNWIEDLATKKGGLLQWMVFRILIISIIRIRRIKIVWVLHNKVSHSNNKIWLKKKIFNYFLKNSDVIITHAKEGLLIISEQSKESTLKSFYYPHPFNKRDRFVAEKDIDVLIWGSISPYKGIHQFLEMVGTNEYMKNLNINICGKILNKEYEKHLYALIPSNVILKNEYITNSELDGLLSRAKITLFTYSSDSILSSGVLSDSFGYGNIIFGPAKGAFNDFHELGFVEVFNELEDIPGLFEEALKKKTGEGFLKEQQAYIGRHSWANFGRAFIEFVEKI